MNTSSSLSILPERVVEKLIYAPVVAAGSYNTWDIARNGNPDALHNTAGFIGGFCIFKICKWAINHSNKEATGQPRDSHVIKIAGSLASIAAGAIAGAVEASFLHGSIARSIVPGAAGGFYAFRATMAMASIPPSEDAPQTADSTRFYSVPETSDDSNLYQSSSVNS